MLRPLSNVLRVLQPPARRRAGSLQPLRHRPTHGPLLRPLRATRNASLLHEDNATARKTPAHVRGSQECFGGGYGARTRDLDNAIVALSQLS